jgi:hypothetical protein
LKFGYLYGDYSHQEKIEEFVRLTGSRIKRLIIDDVEFDPLKVINWFPNLKSFKLCGNYSRSEKIKFDLKSTKIERIDLIQSPTAASLLESLEKCAIKEAELKEWSEVSSEIIQKFLKSQEKSLKKLFIYSHFNLSIIPKGLRLEHFELFDSRSDTISLEFLQHQIDLKTLKLTSSNYSNESFNTICGLKSLKALELNGWTNDRSGLDNLHKLKNLKKFKVSFGCNILDHLQFGVFNDLEELDAWFFDASLESIQEMKRITPNLNKIIIRSNSSDTVNVLLDHLESLEAVQINCHYWQIPSLMLRPNIKDLRVDCKSDQKFIAEQFTEVFPNLEFLQISSCRFEVTESSITTLLSGLKQLKTLNLDFTNNANLDSELILQCFQVHGKHLEKIEVNAYENSLENDDYIIGFTIKKEINECIRVCQIFGEDYYDHIY